MPLRARVFAVPLPGRPAPWDRCAARLFYAAGEPVGEALNTGLLPPVDGHGQRAVIVLMPGMNLPCSSYRWLAEHLVEAGFVVVAYDHVESPLPGLEGLGPGLDIERLRPGAATGSPSTILDPLLEALERLNREVLVDCIDTNQVVLFGHSAGGTTALFSAGWHPQIQGVITYGAHAGVSMNLGYPAGTVRAVEGQVPTLLLGGDADGVIQASAHRYGGTEGDATYLLRRTFHESLRGSGHGLIVLRGGRHLGACHPHDASLGRGFLEDASVDSSAARHALAELTSAFARRCTGGPDLMPVTLTAHAAAVGHSEWS
ncbi:MAG: hypothetical protein CMP23_05680 [Rickettsiales bacterium]|nr:hypothetical protein [Rickettsiales bacterium]|tara:strand:- start:35 stop:982 length:948 start_codon:yes stop_codon:yes gene_type:complete